MNEQNNVLAAFDALLLELRRAAVERDADFRLIAQHLHAVERLATRYSQGLPPRAPKGGAE